MLFADEREAYEYARLNNIKIINEAYTEVGFEVAFDTVQSNSVKYFKEWEEEQAYWGICTVTSNGSRMYKSDVAAIAKKLKIKQKEVRDITFNKYEAKLLTKRQAEQKAYYLTRNGSYLWEAVRLKY